MKELAKTYDPKAFEKRIYESWEKDGDFHALRDPDKKPFTIVMPPPNITGQLHMGHAFDHTVQDVLIRWRRMQGYSALWLPGTDHASIATEVKVADEIFAAEGKTKEEIGREEFLKRAWQWKEEYGNRITEQQRRLGNSCDWERERFTMDEGCNKAVIEFFVRLYDKGLIYKGSRLINWCPVCGTAISDAEVEYEDLEGKYWYIRYPSPDGGEGITVATSRPETMFADVCIAVNPKDERFRHMVGKTVLLPIKEKELLVVADPYPDPEKGTGAVKITPAHDPNDFDVGERHGMPQPVCIDFEAKMTEEAFEYEGLDRFECRKKWVDALDDAGFIVKTEDVLIPIGRCYRCDTIIEPMISEQWFVSMKELAEPAIQAANKKDLKVVPVRFEKIYLRWLEEIRDWCISRQLWWGHRIPAWYCGVCGKMTVAREEPDYCPDCGAKGGPGGALSQDENVLDTWFSSGLWPFSTLGWPEDTPDLRYFFPTNVLVTAYDILFFWVIRMVFSSLEIMGETPFEYAFIHGIVRDENGEKMSKSKGNGVDPLEVVEAFGADALRFFLLNGSAAGNDMRFIEKDVESTRNFANKLWNASRFVLMNLGEDPGEISSYKKSLLDEDKWILSVTGRVAAEVTENLEKFEMSLATQKIHDLIRDEFCDWYIEFVKPRLQADDEDNKAQCRAVLVHVLSDLLRLLHPFMPFITEEIWGYIGRPGKLICDTWPEQEEYIEEESFITAAKRIETLKNVIRAIRNIRAEAGAAPSRKFPVIIKGAENFIDKQTESHIINLAGVSDITLLKDDADLPEEAASAITHGMVIYVPLAELIDLSAELARLKKELQRLTDEKERLSVKLSNKGFTEKAPAGVVESERLKLTAAEEARIKVAERINQIEGK
jgi:valyl-tRNA synthetase